LTALGIGPGVSMFAIDADAAQRRLEHVPWIKRARVLRLLPSTLHVEIVERQPFAIWQENGKLHLIDAEGRKIAPLGQRSREDFLLVVGKGAGASAKELSDQLKDFAGLRQRLQAAIRVADRRWTLKLRNGLEVKLPEHGVLSALQRLDQLEREGRVLSADISALDLRLSDRITLRLREQAGARRKNAKGKKVVQGT
jgi:cell division protein FtsQ